jgi:A/G-specific adenine glycosylase
MRTSWVKSDSVPIIHNGGANIKPSDGDNSLTAALLAWYGVARRDLPWRHTTDPYSIWVSEIMLQQTQVSTVIPYYARFLARFPTVVALAEATLDEVLVLWQGLGYYARARSLHKAARLVHGQYQGIIPADLASFRALPGVGDYTAGAVLSIAFGQDVPAIDGNVVRVLCRLCDYDQDPGQAAGKRVLRSYATALLPLGQAGTFNQAMMELGATICLPRNPRCDVCPLAGRCLAQVRGVQEARPIRKPRAAIPQREAVAAFVAREGKLLLVRRVAQGLLGGLWELPGGEIVSGETHTQALIRHLSAELGVQIEQGARLTVVQHAYTHFRVTVHVYRVTLAGEPLPTASWDHYGWVAPEDMGAYGLTGVTTRALAQAHAPLLL